MAMIDGLDAIKAILPTLKPKEIEELRNLLKIDVCQTLGHKYRKAGTQRRLLLPTRTVLFCERCGHISFC